MKAKIYGSHEGLFSGECKIWVYLGFVNQRTSTLQSSPNPVWQLDLNHKCTGLVNQRNSTIPSTPNHLPILTLFCPRLNLSGIMWIKIPLNASTVSIAYLVHILQGTLEGVFNSHKLNIGVPQLLDIHKFARTYTAKKNNIYILYIQVHLNKLECCGKVQLFQ